jgi:hypothetical protein
MDAEGFEIGTGVTRYAAPLPTACCAGAGTAADVKGSGQITLATTRHSAALDDDPQGFDGPQVA